MTTMQTTLAKIRSTHLGYEDHGTFSALIAFDYGGSSQGWGPIALGDQAHNIIAAVLTACGVDSWERLVGRTVFVVRDEGWNGLIRGMAPLPTEPGEGFVVPPGEFKIESYKVET
jgi:hypothetical protein